MALDVAASTKVNSLECISCSECVNVCPVENTLNYTAPGKKKISSWIILMGTLGIFIIVIGMNTFNKSFVWKADSGLEKKAERLLWGPQRIKDDNTLMEVIQIYQIHPAYFAQEFNLDKEEQFYSPLSELGIPASEIENLVNKVYQEAGLDPTKLFGEGHGGGHGGGGGQGDH
jgi:ferredoxin